MKELTAFQIAAVKRQFKNSLPTLKKIEAIDKKIEELQAERNTCEALLEAGEAGIKILTEGYKSTDLIKCTYETVLNEDGTPKMNGKYPQKKQILTFEYPVETVDTCETCVVNPSIETINEITD